MTKPKIYFHVGLGKTASTYLQMDVFPKFQNIYYIPTNRYKKAFDIIAKGEHNKYLVSREFDRQLEEEVKKFSTKYPNAHPIIFFRRHDGWMASQYRRQVKNGHTFTFKQYFDVVENKGVWDRSEANFYNKLMILEKYFTNKPLVLFYEELRENQLDVIDKIASFTGATYSKSDVSTSKTHSSYSEKQLKGFMRIARIIPIRKRHNFKFKPLKLFFNLGIQGMRYPLLFLMKIIPDYFFSNAPLIDPRDREEVRNYFSKDWERIKAYANENNPVL